MNTVPSSEAIRLSEQLKTRNTDAFKEMYDKYASGLYTIICRMVRQSHVAEELLQDVFVKVWRNIEKYDPYKASLFTWLVHITRNIGIDYMRTAPYRFRFNQNDDLPNEKPSGVHLQDHHFENREVRSLAYKLDDKYRQVIDLVYFWGYSQEEVSRMLNIPLGTVKTRSRTGLQLLRKFYHVNNILEKQL